MAKATEAGGSEFIVVTMNTTNALKSKRLPAIGDMITVSIETILDQKTDSTAIFAGSESEKNNRGKPWQKNSMSALISAEQM